MLYRLVYVVWRLYSDETLKQNCWKKQNLYIVFVKRVWFWTLHLFQSEGAVAISNRTV